MAPIFVNHNGTRKPVNDLYANINDVRKRISRGWVNVNGVAKLIFSGIGGVGDWRITRSTSSGFNAWSAWGTIGGISGSGSSASAANAALSSNFSSGYSSSSTRQYRLNSRGTKPSSYSDWSGSFPVGVRSGSGSSAGEARSAVSDGFSNAYPSTDTRQYSLGFVSVVGS